MRAGSRNFYRVHANIQTIKPMESRCAPATNFFKLEEYF